MTLPAKAPDPAEARPAAAAVPAVQLRDVAVTRGGRTVFDKSTFSIEPGSVVGVIGPNGSGKTTLLKVLLGLLPVAAGSVQVLGRTPRRGDRTIGYVPQNYTATTGEAVRARDLVGLGVAGPRWGSGRLSRAERDRVTGSLAAVSALDLAERRMSALSGGQQQRVAIAQALVDDPALLLLDEPLANLDVRNQREIVMLLSALNQQRAVTILVVAHDLNPLLSALTGAVYLLDGHAHYDALDEVVNSELLSHLYGTSITAVRTAQGDLFTRSS
jgi:zinc/manganese transport system ATP-binding protein